jgi:transcriptional regulator with XRE-family HTH domain
MPKGIRKDPRRDEFAAMVEEMQRSAQLDLEGAKVQIAEEIHLAMERQGVTKVELAKRLDTSRAYVTKILQGTANFTIESLTKIARCLGCSWEVKLAPNSLEPRALKPIQRRQAGRRPDCDMRNSRRRHSKP